MRNLLASLLLICSLHSTAQYKFDNVLFKTVYLEDLCAALKNNPGYLLLDVRSKGENRDTSASLSLNIGHLPNANNIDIREMGTRIHELDDYKNKPVFVYCSHSQRSRRVSKMLADSGFTKVFNINGGLTSIHLFSTNIEDCKDLEIETALPYKLITPAKLYAGKTNYYIIDVRNDSVFNGISPNEQRKAYGKLQGAVNIPLSGFASRLSEINTSKPILIVDDFGSESPKAAQMLIDKGFKNISVVFNGMDALVQYKPEKSAKKELQWVPIVKYKLLTGETFDKLMQKGNVSVIDVRSKDEFNNSSKDAFRNIGNIKSAKNFPFNEIKSDPSKINLPKQDPIVIYAMSNQTEVFETAKLLSGQGYTNVNVLLGGLFNLRWKAANLKGRSALKDWVVNIPDENL